MAKGRQPRQKPRNWEIADGLMRFSRARMYQRRGVYKKKPFGPQKKKHPKVEEFVVKKIGGEKNGGERKVPKQRAPKLLSEFRDERKAKRTGRTPPTKLKKSLTPGTVCILLAGIHKGKRCVFLKQLEGGLCLVTGPLKLNNIPLRRVAQCYVIATRTKLDISSVKIPDHINDAYFRRAKKTRRLQKKAEDTDIFAAKKEKYAVSDQRKADQKNVDGALLAVIKKHPEKKLMFGYLGSTFAIRKNEYPHNLKF